MNIAVIPARSGSKRLPGKNLKLLDHRPLLAYSILFAKSLPWLDLVLVTSDSDLYLSCARHWGADITIKRPPELATDEAPMLTTIQHAVQQVESEVSLILLLQPNCPLRDQSSIDQALSTYQSDCSTTAVISADIGPYKLGHIRESGQFLPSYPSGSRKQDLPHMARENGVFYLLRSDNINHGSLFGIGKTVAVETPVHQSQSNIDTQHDFKIARFNYYEYGYFTTFQDIEQDLKMKGVVTA